MAPQNIADLPAPSFAELLSGSVVDLYIGPDKKHWALHRNLLCHHSPYIDNELNNDHKKKTGGEVTFADATPAAFELLVKWMYQGQIQDVSNIEMERKWDYAETCQNLYFLCEKLQIPLLRNIAIDQFRKGCNEAGLVPGPDEMKPVYAKTPVGSPFRRLVSKIAARQIMDPGQEKDASSYRAVFDGNADFAVDVINAIKDGAGGSLFDDPTEGSSCRYHEHENGESCHKTVHFEEDKKVKIKKEPND